MSSPGTTGRPLPSRPVPCRFSRGQPSVSAAAMDSCAVRISSSAPSPKLPLMYPVMDENIAPVAASASTSCRVQSQISASKPASAIRWTRSVMGRSRNIISAQTASRIGMLLPYDAVMSESTPAGVPAATFPITTGLGLPGAVIERDLGLAFGLVVRSMGFAKSFGAGLTSLRQGEVPQYTRLLEDSRRHAIDRMVENARLLGANAIVAMRFDSSEISQQLTEIVAYGTAVVVRAAG